VLLDRHNRVCDAGTAEEPEAVQVRTETVKRLVDVVVARMCGDRFVELCVGPQEGAELLVARARGAARISARIPESSSNRASSRCRQAAAAL
jgi:hypothetical protein